MKIVPAVFAAIVAATPASSMVGRNKTMTGKIVTDYLRDLAVRLLDVPLNVDDRDAQQLIDLADTLDEESNRGLDSLLAEFATHERTTYDR